MKRIIYILIICLCSSCYYSRYLGDDIEQENKQGQIDNHKYMKYQDPILNGYNEVHIIMFLEDLEIPNHNISINRITKVENSEIKIMTDNIYGTYKRYLHIFIIEENGIDIVIKDTIKIE